MVALDLPLSILLYDITMLNYFHRMGKWFPHHQSQFDVLAYPTPSVDIVVYLILCVIGPHLPISPFSSMDLPLHAYFFSPLNGRIDQKSLWINPRVFTLNYNIDMDVKHISALHTISFSHPRLHPNGHGDFCIYFALETQEVGTLVTDLALFIQDIGWKLIKWSVLGCPDCLGPGNPIHPVLHDLTYCWDGVATAYRVLQFSTQPVAVMNIQQVFHRTVSTSLPSVFSEMESAAHPMTTLHSPSTSQDPLTPIYPEYQGHGACSMACTPPPLSTGSVDVLSSSPTHQDMHHLHKILISPNRSLPREQIMTKEAILSIQRIKFSVTVYTC
ncbi:hypothetical protein BDM02DRAFT_3131239 [Thelephora ganbajun]|uniref:Uncharacterized protein n=1 Tax=Thelephora ganbajun TaxID=370292 RepID=A0ACB6Z6R3_THEGA|nr:hypothetical protein BDM02DRAFT_3131239 [Thelephora ganbajun]